MKALSPGPIAVLLSIVLVSLGTADDWPQFRGPKRNNVSDETGWLVNWPPPLLWSYDLTGSGGYYSSYNNVAVSGGRVYVHGGWREDHRLECLDAATGEVIWQSDYAVTWTDMGVYDNFNGSKATPAVLGGRVYTCDEAGVVGCWDAATGTNVWQQRIVPTRFYTHGFALSPLVDGDRVVYGVHLALHKDTGAVLWGSLDCGTLRSYCAPKAFDGIDGRRLYALHGGIYDATNGVIETNEVVTGYLTQKCMDMIHLGDGRYLNSSLVYYTNRTAEVATLPRHAQWSRSCVVLDGHAYYASTNNNLICVELQTGQTKWDSGCRITDEYGYGGGVIAADGKLIFSAYGGGLGVARVTPERFDLEGREIVQACNGSQYAMPVLADGNIYLMERGPADACRKLHCYRTGLAYDFDGDDDGIPDLWEIATMAGTNECDPWADPDRDRAVNYEEFVAGTDPTNGQSVLSLNVAAEDSCVVLSFDGRGASGPAYEGLTRWYDMQSCVDLCTGTWRCVPGLSNVSATTDRTIEYTNSAPGKAAFYRVRARLNTDMVPAADAGP